MTIAVPPLGSPEYAALQVRMAENARARMKANGTWDAYVVAERALEDQLVAGRPIAKTILASRRFVNRVLG